MSLEAKGLSPALCGHLAKLGIGSIGQLLLHLPLRYDDETRIVALQDLVEGTPACVEVEIVKSQVQFRPRRTLMVETRDDSGALLVRLLHFNQGQIQAFTPGSRWRLFGEMRMGFHGPEMIHPRFRRVQESTPLEAALTPIYPTTAGLTQPTLRKAILRFLGSTNLPDTLPEHERLRLGLPAFGESLQLLHQPQAETPVQSLMRRTHPAWRRIKFDELLAQQLSMRLHYRERNQLHAPALFSTGEKRQAFVQQLGFTLTGAQLRAAAEIEADLQQSHPMHRLLQGDVGSGKTVVAALACLAATEAGFQSALMAPTEILAEQHFRKIEALLQALDIKTAWLTGRMKAREKKAALEQIANGEARLVIGTHALIQEDVFFQKLGLVIIDEQHRFGVEQRLALRAKSESGLQPHLLMMSATPIPRTLSMSYFADLDLSTLDELPPGRTPIVTRLVDNRRRDEVLARIQTACAEGGQVYWVCPLIEESETLELQTAMDTWARLQTEFPDLRVGLLHGRLPAPEKSSVMNAFESGEIDLLVATTVVEVGVDVPNANIMVIEHAERMGLSQLHQLRGRVGRGRDQGYCILLFQQPLSETARQRLKVIYDSTDGFAIAQADLTLRGPGEYLGARQSGAPLLRFADLEQDQDLMMEAKALAERWLEQDPEAAHAHVERYLGQRSQYLRA
jgi:ATP-dependent DNA helicase RecG